jgi:hypothetical protein
VCARASTRVKVGGKPVKRDAWLITEGVLTAFNEMAGTKLRLLTSAGEASAAAKRVYLRVVDYPDIKLEEHRDIIRRTLASRWWGPNDPTIGVVYGPRVFEDNITRSPEPVRRPGEKKAKPWAGALRRLREEQADVDE